MNKIVWLFGLVISLLLSSCSKNSTPADYDVNEVGRLKKVAAGIIISKQAVKFHSKEAANNKAEKAPGSEYIDGGHGYVYVIKLNNGAIVSVAQAEDSQFKIKQHILVIYGKTTRILPDDGSSN